VPLRSGLSLFLVGHQNESPAGEAKRHEGPTETELAGSGPMPTRWERVTPQKLWDCLQYQYQRLRDSQAKCDHLERRLRAMSKERDALVAELARVRAASREEMQAARGRWETKKAALESKVVKLGRLLYKVVEQKREAGQSAANGVEAVPEGPPAAEADISLPSLELSAADLSAEHAGYRNPAAVARTAAPFLPPPMIPSDFPASNETRLSQSSRLDWDLRQPESDNVWLPMQDQLPLGSHAEEASSSGQRYPAPVAHDRGGHLSTSQAHYDTGNGTVTTANDGRDLPKQRRVGPGRRRAAKPASPIKRAGSGSGGYNSKMVLHRLQRMVEEQMAGMGSDTTAASSPPSKRSSMAVSTGKARLKAVGRRHQSPAAARSRTRASTAGATGSHRSPNAGDVKPAANRSPPSREEGKGAAKDGAAAASALRSTHQHVATKNQSQAVHVSVRQQRNEKK